MNEEAISTVEVPSPLALVIRAAMSAGGPEVECRLCRG